MQITADGASLAVLDEGNGPAIVLLHGFPLSKETWDAQAEALARYARVVRLDLRGLGRSSVPAGPYLMEALAGDVADVLDVLRIERAVIVGHSLGGFVTYAFYRLFAERCLGLGIVCSRSGADDAATALAREALAVRAELEGIGPVTDAFVPRYFAPSVYVERPELAARARDVVGRTDPRGAASILRGMAARFCADDLLEEIDIPVRIVAGAEDAFVDVGRMKRTADAIRGAKLDVFACGHFPLWEAPDHLTASLQGLVGDATSASAT